MDITERINGETFLIRVPIIATLSDYDLATQGVFINEYEDASSKANHEEMIIVGKPILEMAIMHSNGYPIYLINPEETKIIYDLLNEFVHNSNLRNTYSPNIVINQADEDVLMILDSFAQEIFDINKGDMAEQKEDIVHFGFENSKLKFMDKYALTRKEATTESVRQSYKPGIAVNISDLLND